MWFKKGRIYADAAAATPLFARSRAELERLLGVYGNAGALHKEGVAAKEELERARALVAKSIGAHPDEIIFTASGTEGNNLALEGVLRPLLLKYGEVNAVVSAIEHPSVLEPLRALEREGLYLTVLPVDHEGFVDPKALRDALSDETALVSVQLVNSEVGTIEPIREIAREIRSVRRSRAPQASQKISSSGEMNTTPTPSEETFASPAVGLPLYFHTDASQAPLWLELRVESLGVDLMTLDAQKIGGPKGVGCLYSKRSTEIEPVLWGGTQEGSMRAGTQNTPQAGAFAVALADADRGVEVRAQKTAAVRDYLWKQIKKRIPEAILNGPTIPQDDTLRKRVANNLNISIPGLEAETAVIAMDAEGIAISTRSACSEGEDEPSHVIKALGSPEELSGTALRITLLPTASNADARRIAETLTDVFKRYKTE